MQAENLPGTSLDIVWNIEGMILFLVVGGDI